MPEREEHPYGYGTLTCCYETAGHEVNRLWLSGRLQLLHGCGHTEMWSASSACRKPRVQDRTAVEMSALRIL